MILGTMSFNCVSYHIFALTGYVPGNVSDSSMHFPCLAPRATDVAMLQNNAVCRTIDASMATWTN